MRCLTELTFQVAIRTGPTVTAQPTAALALSADPRKSRLVQAASARFGLAIRAIRSLSLSRVNFQPDGSATVL